MSKQRRDRNRRQRPVGRSVHRAPTKGDIAAAVHRAVCAVTDTDGFGHCCLYATTVREIATKLTGRRFEIQAGSSNVATGVIDAEGYLTAVGHDVDGGTVNGVPGGLGNGEFHAWVMEVPRTATAGCAEVIRPHTEVIDLSLRHFPQLAMRTGVPWSRTDLPDYYWGPWQGLLDLDIQYRSSWEATQLINSPRERRHVADAIVIAVELLGLISASKAMTALTTEGQLARMRAQHEELIVLDLSSGQRTAGRRHPVAAFR
jgi:hypothetical protein